MQNMPGAASGSSTDPNGEAEMVLSTVIETVPLFGGGNEAAAITSAVIAAIGFLGFGMWTTCYAIFRLIEG
jgi:hypothetical protein